MISKTSIHSIATPSNLSLSSTIAPQPTAMATQLTTSRALLRFSQPHSLLRPATTQTSHLHTSPRRAALPHGPPPAGYRMPKPARWNTDGSTALDKASKYFLLTEMFRGMWVVLEQFFRPPYVYPPLSSSTRHLPPKTRHKSSPRKLYTPEETYARRRPQ